MKKNKLLPLKRKRTEGTDSISKDEVIMPLDRMRQRLERHTKQWPITISSTSVFNLRPVSSKFSFINVFIFKFIEKLR